MAIKIIVKNGELEAAIRTFKRAISENERIKKRKQYYLKPSLRKKEKQKIAAKKRNKYRKKKVFYNNL